LYFSCKKDFNLKCCYGCRFILLHFLIIVFAFLPCFSFIYYTLVFACKCLVSLVSHRPKKSHGFSEGRHHLYFCAEIKDLMKYRVFLAITTWYLPISTRQNLFFNLECNASDPGIIRKFLISFLNESVLH
jgi:hypothetical protein